MSAADDCCGFCACLCCCCSIFGSCSQPGSLCNIFGKIVHFRRNAEDEAFAAQIEREMQHGGSLSMRHSEAPSPTKPMAMHSRQQSKPPNWRNDQQGLVPPEHEHRRQGSASSSVEKERPRDASSVPIVSSDVAPGLDGQGYPLAVENKIATV